LRSTFSWKTRHSGRKASWNGYGEQLRLSRRIMGKFSVRCARVSVIQNNDDDQSIHGTTWGMWTGFKASLACASVEPYRELILRQTGP
jgi:hypothetical protein